ncbi:DUF2277 domain-containing protein [Streptacidiphilus pinicola]|uniref:DUF2277 domain-containing protein n=1 Tax=Streptacidiphilus pinicola TaxID=2219663 RepID=A0A2X0IG96_9ACTN|nr:DUF2277 domain-containing protein [Streptacidiphilus pinicola]RAG82643.1 DUF2277 domain-containing protein [Streptacidiphilus pinicola]
MCRSIKTLRAPVTPDPQEADIHAAALQYVRKVSGFRAPAAHNREAFDSAVEAIAEATRELLESLVVRGAHAHPHPHDQQHEHEHVAEAASV